MVGQQFGSNYLEDLVPNVDTFSTYMRVAVCILSLVFSLAACSDDKSDSEVSDGTDAADGTDTGDMESFVIPFTATVNDQPIKCGEQYKDVGLSKSEIELRDFRFFVYDVQLLDKDGKSTPFHVEADGLHQLPYEKKDGSQGGLVLLDFTDTGSDLCADRGTAETHMAIVGKAPKGDYTKVAFSVGVPPELNHLNGSVSEAPLNVYGMQWTWQSGYRHVKLEFAARTAESAGKCSSDEKKACKEDAECGDDAKCDGYKKEKYKPKYYFHPGSQGCESESGEISGVYSCDNELNSYIELEFTPGTSAVQADVGRLLSGINMYLGRGCMFANTMADIGGDGFGVPSPTGCPEMYASIGIKLPEVPASTPETMGQCTGDKKVECKADSDCSDKGTCDGYEAAATAEKAEQIAQTLFAKIDYSGEGTAVKYPAVDDLKANDPFGWPHKDYKRDEKLDVSAISSDGGTKSHPKGDKRYGATCTKCHQSNGPGRGQYVVSGTIRAMGGDAYTAGGTIQMGTGVGNRFGPKTHPIEDKIFNWKKLYELPIDGNGNFYATADNVKGIDYGKDNYFVKIYATKGTCKTQATGAAVENDKKENVSCATDDDCKTLTYDIAGDCADKDGNPIIKFGKPVTCNEAADCKTEGAACNGASKGNVPVCDKLINAMAIAAPGSCNHCHKTGFHIYDSPNH